ncbi:MAG: hypothetical protein ACTSVI_04810 [Promethearchaeota archaeon]
MPISVAFYQCSSCWGCHQSLLNLHLGLLPVFPELDIKYWPAVVDFKFSDLEGYEDGSIDVGFVEGMLRTEHDVHGAKVMRKKCKILIAFGACACYGGVKGLANQFSREELLKRKFEEAESVAEPNDMLNNRDPDLTPITESVVNLDKVVKIDAYIPGCPPKKENILGAVSFLIKKSPENMDKSTNVCATCQASPCLLEQGKLCWGSITAGGCGLMCPNSGDSCVGCFGSTDNIDAGKAGKLKGLLSSLSPASAEQANQISKFLILYNGLPTQGTLFLAADPMRKLAIKTPIDFSNDVVGTSLKALANSPNYTFMNGNVCSTCDRNANMTKKMDKIKRVYEGLPDTEQCLLNQGYICMGPVTQAGCGAVCPNANSVCSGCYGPVFGISDQGARAMSTMASLADVDISEIKEKILDPVGLFYRFTLAAAEINKKVNDTEG